MCKSTNKSTRDTEEGEEGEKKTLKKENEKRM